VKTSLDDEATVYDVGSEGRVSLTLDGQSVTTFVGMP